jgi:hypothetical protein
MRARIAKPKTNRSTFILIGAVVLAIVLWPVVERVAEKLTAGLQAPAPASGPSQPKK